jgi:hypothetical protein
MDYKLIENEVNKRVAFKMEEIRSQFLNRLAISKLADRASWGHVYTRGNLKAWEDVKEVLNKEISMGTPYDGNMAERVWKDKEAVVDKLSNRLLKRGTRSYDYDKSFINNCIEEFIKY